MRIRLLLLGCLAIWLAACTTDTQPTPTTAPPATNTPEPGPGPTDTPDEYPGVPTLTPSPFPYGAEPPTPTPFPDGYDAGAEEVLPEGLLVVRPQGKQCTDASEFEYATAEQAAADLEAAGVTVLAVYESNRPVCEACDCSTSLHFEVVIEPTDLEMAQALGWIQEGE